MKEATQQKTQRCKTFKEWEKEAWALLEQSMFACSAKDLYKAIPLPIGYAPKHVSAWLKQKYKNGQLSMLQPVPKEAHKYLIPKGNKGLKGIHIKDEKTPKQVNTKLISEPVKKEKSALAKEVKTIKVKTPEQKQTEIDVCSDIILILNSLIDSIQDLKKQVETIKADI